MSFGGVWERGVSLRIASASEISQCMGSVV